MNDSTIELHRALVNRIKKLDGQYYNGDGSTVSDEEYDQLRRRLIQLEKNNPGLLISNVDETVGAPLQSTFERVKHSKPMLSIQDIFMLEDVDGWKSKLPKDTLCTEEVKADGVSISLVYLGGVLHMALTRGDGREGENITENAKQIPSIPKYFQRGDVGENAVAVIRGEVVIHKDRFKAINEKRAASGLSVYSNERNYASGSLRQIDPLVTRYRELDFYAYDVEYPDESHNKLDYIEKMNHLRDEGIATLCHFQPVDIRKGREYNEALVPFAIDGVVIKVNSQVVRNELGSRNRSPRWAIAYKFPSPAVLTTLTEVVVQVGRTGVLTPVAKIEPIALGGTIIDSPTLHNWDEIERLDLHYGDTVEVTRAGDVIPKITKSIKELRSSGAKPVMPPTECPCCKGHLIRTGGFLICTESNCSAKTIRAIEHAASRKALDIREVGPTLITNLVDSGAVSGLYDLMTIDVETLKTAGGLSAKRASKAYSSIVKSRNVTLQKLIYALGIPEVGEGTSERLSVYIDQLEGLITVSHETLNAIPDIGPETANSIITWRNNNVERIQALGKVFDIIPTEQRDASMLGWRVVVTGSDFGGIKRAETEASYRQRGAKLSSHVSKNTTLLVFGEGGSEGKLARARELGVAVKADF